MGGLSSERNTQIARGEIGKKETPPPELIAGTSGLEIVSVIKALKRDSSLTAEYLKMIIKNGPYEFLSDSQEYFHVVAVSPGRYVLIKGRKPMNIVNDGRNDADEEEYHKNHPKQAHDPVDEPAFRKTQMTLD